MPMKFQRPDMGHSGQPGLVNRDKYQQDAGASPRRAISSVKIDGDFNYLIDAVNETWDAMVAESFTSALPDQAGNAGKVPVTDGTNASWQLLTGANMQPGSVGVDRLTSPGASVLIGSGADGAVTGIGLGSGLALSNGTLTAQGSAGVPVGVINAFAGVEAPAGWLMCNGQTVSRTTYATLFAAIGTMHGSGDGSTTFVVPDLRGRSVFGIDNMGGATDSGRLSYPNVMGGNGGNQRKTFTTDATALTVDQLPAHKHTLMGRNNGGAIAATNGLLAGSAAITSGNGLCTDVTDAMSSTGSGQGHTHTVTNLDVMPPYILLNYIIKY